MNLKEIQPDVYYCGVNDRVSTLFEGLWPLPNGVSYNSYIVRGPEKTALIDTVHEANTPEFFHALGVSGNASEERVKIDYLIVNHMEPDHSGAIPLLLRAYPDLKIVANRVAIGMIKSFYGISQPEVFLEIKDGDTLSLGEGMELKFLLTPMVHWPETMMTWLEARKTLFTGDAFGTFGALDGGIVDDELDTELYRSEMYRYYSNIVGKYGVPVQRAMAKALPLGAEWVCPTHGPVWHTHLQEAVSLYDRLSRQEWEDGVTIIYGTMYGNTGEAADAIARRLKERGVKTVKVHNASHSTLSEMISDAFRYKGLIVGSPTYNGNLFPPVEALMKSMEVREVKGKIFACFGNYAWAPAATKILNDKGTALGWDNMGSFTVKMAMDSSAYDSAAGVADSVAEALLS
ncbi:MAG: FprA family A-type flavoprotein [Muribaculaceae bacterium]|nr:FprA family A-type flavoprotein [Muribaculaceae bacterium]